MCLFGYWNHKEDAFIHDSILYLVHNQRGPRLSDPLRLSSLFPYTTVPERNNVSRLGVGSRV